MQEQQDIRIDKFLWAVRLFKTRTQATEACKKGKIFMKEVPVKPSRMVIEGDIIQIKQNPIIREFLIVKLLHNRVGAKLVADYLKEITSEDELLKLKIFIDMQNQSYGKRERGTGRPTKKERRELDYYIFSDDE